MEKVIFGVFWVLITAHGARTKVFCSYVSNSMFFAGPESDEKG